MRYLMNLINLKNVSAAVTAVGIAVCLVPQSVQALGRHPGSPIGNTVAYDYDDNAENLGTISFPIGFDVEPVPNPVAVPEPNTTAGSILSIGVGALLLLKRKNRYKKLAQSRLTLSK